MERKIKIFNIIHGNFQTSFKKFHVDGVSNDSKKSVDEKSNVILVVTPRAQMANKVLKTLDNNNGVQRST
jgi:hypothetical protein